MVRGRYIVAAGVVGLIGIGINRFYNAFKMLFIKKMEQIDPITSPFFPKDYKFSDRDSSGFSEDVKDLQEHNLAKPIGYDTNLQCSVRHIMVNMLNNQNFAEKAPNHKDCYNCLGWSLWEKNHLALSDKPFRTIEAKKREVASFIKLHSNFDKKDFALGSTEFPCFKLYTREEASQISNVKNAMAFYFHNDGWTHAARYVDDIPDREDIKGWTSKLNYDSLVAHDTPEKLYGMYGEVAIYAIPEVCN